MEVSGMGGDISMSGFKIRHLGQPQHQNDAARKFLEV